MVPPQHVCLFDPAVECVCVVAPCVVDAGDVSIVVDQGSLCADTVLFGAANRSTDTKSPINSGRLSSMIRFPDIRSELGANKNLHRSLTKTPHLLTPQVPTDSLPATCRRPAVRRRPASFAPAARGVAECRCAWRGQARAACDLTAPCHVALRARLAQVLRHSTMRPDDAPRARLHWQRIVAWPSAVAQSFFRRFLRMTVADLKGPCPPLSRRQSAGTTACSRALPKSRALACLRLLFLCHHTRLGWHVRCPCMVIISALY